MRPCPVHFSGRAAHACSGHVALIRWWPRIRGGAYRLIYSQEFHSTLFRCQHYLKKKKNTIPLGVPDTWALHISLSTL